MSRVKKIIAVDPDISICSNNASFAITLATVSHLCETHVTFQHAHYESQELFIQYLAEQGQNMAKMERKPRRNIQYKDLGEWIEANHIFKGVCRH